MKMVWKNYMTIVLDLNEWKNVAEDPKYKQIKRSLIKELNHYFK